MKTLLPYILAFTTLAFVACAEVEDRKIPSQTAGLRNLEPASGLSGYFGAPSINPALALMENGDPCAALETAAETSVILFEDGMKKQCEFFSDVYSCRYRGSVIGNQVTMRTQGRTQVINYSDEGNGSIKPAAVFVDGERVQFGSASYQTLNTFAIHPTVYQPILAENISQVHRLFARCNRL